MGIASTGWVSNIDQEAQILSPRTTNLSTHEIQSSNSPAALLATRIFHRKKLQSDCRLPQLQTLRFHFLQTPLFARIRFQTSQLVLSPLHPILHGPFISSSLQETDSPLKHKTSPHENPLPPTHLASVSAYPSSSPSPPSPSPASLYLLLHVNHSLSFQSTSRIQHSIINTPCSQLPS